MSRGTLRTLFCLTAIVGGILTAVFLGDYVVNPGLSPAAGTPLPYFGYGLAALGGLGLCGVNVFIGGPLDPRHDPPAGDDEAGMF